MKDEALHLESSLQLDIPRSLASRLGYQQAALISLARSARDDMLVLLVGEEMKDEALNLESGLQSDIPRSLASRAPW